MNFMGMSLSALCKAFGIEEVTKGFFPHYMNTKENENYIGPIPAPSFYGDSTMSPSVREKFMKWHTQQVEEGKVFNMKEEIKKYCHSDVMILREACRKFRKLMWDATGDRVKIVDPRTRAVSYKYVDGVDPFSFITIASVCMAVFRYIFLEEDWAVLLQKESEKAEKENREPVWVPGKCRNKGRFFVLVDGKWLTDSEIQIKEKRFVKSPIAVIPSCGYGSQDNYSQGSIQWLTYMEQKTGRKIRHALNDGEFVVRNDQTGRDYRLDGYCEYVDEHGVKRKVCYEYNGCVHHARNH